MPRNKKNPLDKDDIYSKLMKGAGAVKPKFPRGSKAYKTRLEKALKLMVEKLADANSAFGMFGMPDKLEDTVESLIRNFDSHVKSIVEKIVDEKLKEYDKARKSEPVCPVCRSYGDSIEDVRQGNNVFGPGYSSHHVYYTCKKCGIIFDLPKKEK